MLQKSKKWLCLVLAVAMILGMAPTAFAADEPPSPVATSNDSGTSDAGADPLADWTGETRLPGYEDLDFNDREFVIAGSTYDAAFSRLPCADIYSEDTDSISTAIRARNNAVERLYNCRIRLIESDSPGLLASADIAGNTHTIDLYNAPHSFSSTGTGDYNVLSLDIDFTNPWWNQEFIRALSAKNDEGTPVLRRLLGDFSVYSMSCTYMLAFNKNVYESADIERRFGDIYDLVRTGKWTMDVFAEMVKAGATETSGNSVFHAEEGDIMGWIRTQYATHAMHAASGLRMVDTVNGAMEFAMADHSAEWVDVIDKAIEIYSIPQGETVSYSRLPDYVENNGTLFFSEIIDALAQWKDRDMPSLGLVPYPKYSEAQDGYYSYEDLHSAPYSVPISVPDVDTLAHFLEVFAAHSRKIVRPAWIDAYCYEYCGDGDSVEMLEMILDSRTYDPGYLLFNKEGEVGNIIDSGKNNTGIWLSRTGAFVEDLIQTYVEELSATPAAPTETTGHGGTAEETTYDSGILPPATPGGTTKPGGIMEETTTATSGTTMPIFARFDFGTRTKAEAEGKTSHDYLMYNLRYNQNYLAVQFTEDTWVLYATRDYVEGTTTDAFALSFDDIITYDFDDELYMGWGGWANAPYTEANVGVAGKWSGYAQYCKIRIKNPTTNNMWGFQFNKPGDGVGAYYTTQVASNMYFQGGAPTTTTDHKTHTKPTNEWRTYIYDICFSAGLGSGRPNDRSIETYKAHIDYVNNGGGFGNNWVWQNGNRVAGIRFHFLGAVHTYDNSGNRFKACDSRYNIRQGNHVEIDYVVFGASPEQLSGYTSYLEDASDGTPAEPIVPTVRDSGTCGEGLTWTFDSEGVLTISGTGTMENYATGGYNTNGGIISQVFNWTAPWADYRTQIFEIVIEDGVTSIGSCAFYGVCNATKLSISSTVESISSQSAFFGCPWITDITVAAGNTRYHSADGCLIDTASKTLILGSAASVIPSDGSVTRIGAGAFYSCVGLTGVTIPNGVTSIEMLAFGNCTGLTSIVIPDSVTSIGDGSFQNCWKLASITVTEGNTKFHSSGNCLIVTASKTLIMGCNTSVIPSDGSVTAIGRSAFYGCEGMTDVVIPDGVTTIGTSAFLGCTGLTSITLPNSVTSIGASAFRYCTGLTSITIPNSVTSIGEGAFNGCTGLTSIMILSSNCTIENGSIPQEATICGYADSTAKTYAKANGNMFVTIEAGSDPNKPTFVGSCGESLTWTFDSNGVLTISGTGKMENYTYYGISISNGMATQVDGWMAPWAAYRTEILEIVVGSGVTSIGSRAFVGAYNATKLSIPNTVESIGAWAFSYCTGLTDITVAEGNPTYHSTGNCLIETANKTLILGCRTSVIPSDGSVTSIGNYAFCGCTGLTSIVIPNNVTSIGEGAFYNCEGLTSIVIPNNVTSIGSQAFQGCRGLTGITIPNSVTSIGDYAFRLCIGLTSIVIPNSVTSIGSQAFYNCLGLTSITIPNSVTSIGSQAFYYCARLTSITIPNSDCTIGSDSIPQATIIRGYAGSTAKAYAKANGNSFVVLDAGSDPGEPTVVDSGTCGEGLTWTFNSNGVLTISGTGKMEDYTYYSFNYSNGIVTQIDDWTAPWAAYRAEILKIVIGDGVTSIGNCAFFGAYNATKVSISDSVESIGDYAFIYGKKLASLTMSEGTTSIGLGAFAGCEDLTSIVIPDSVTSIDSSAFEGCTGLTSIIVAIGNTKYHSTGNCLIETASKTLILGCKTSLIPSDGSVTSIGDWAFYGCTGLTSITIPSSVTSIGEGAFYGCTGLTSITVADGNTNYHSSGNCLIETASKTLIQGCNTSVIPMDGSVTSIGDYAFCRCTGLTSIVIPDSVTIIGSGAFFVCTSLTNVIYCGTEAQWNAVSKENSGIGNTVTIVYHAEHTWNSGVVTVAPTQTNNGVKTYTCTVCGATKTEAIPPIGVPANAPQLAADPITTTAGEEIQIPIYLRNNPGISGLVVSIQSSGEAFTYLSSTNGSVFTSSTEGVSQYPQLVFTCSGGEASYANGTLCTLTLKVNESTLAGNYTIAVEVMDCADSEDREIAVASCSVNVEVIDFIYGDVNGDGKIRIADATLLLKYLANYDYTTGVSTVEVFPGADCNGDGKIRIADATLLLKYLANYDYSTGTSTVVLGK